MNEITNSELLLEILETKRIMCNISIIIINEFVKDKNIKNTLVECFNLIDYKASKKEQEILGLYDFDK